MLLELHKDMEHREAVADAAAFEAEKEVACLGELKRIDEADFVEARLWLASVSPSGAPDLSAGSTTADSALWMLGVIHRRTLKIFSEASALHETREYFVRENSCTRLPETKSRKPLIGCCAT